MMNMTMNLPPSSKPPTPPMGTKMGTLRGDRSIYRAPPAVAPPQVPSHYAPNYPMGHPKRQNSQSEQRGYTTLPLQTGHPQQQASLNQVPLSAAGIPFKQRDIQPMSHQQIIYAENKCKYNLVLTRVYIPRSYHKIIYLWCDYFNYLSFGNYNWARFSAFATSTPSGSADE